MGARTRGFANNVLTAGKIDASDGLSGVVPNSNVNNTSVSGVTSLPPSVGSGIASVSSNPAAPGLLESHYAPSKPFILGDLDQLIQEHKHDKKRMGILSLQRIFSNMPIESQMMLSEKGDLKEAAQNLFAAMRALDELDLDLILAERMPDQGLGKAINDRLNRAAAK